MTMGDRVTFSPPTQHFGSIPKILFALFLAMAGMLSVLQMNAPTANAQDIDPTSWADVLVDGQINPPANSGYLVNVVGPAGDTSGIVCHVEPLDQDADVSLGPGGWVTVQFTDNALTGSGDNAPDLFIHETGGQVEEFQVFISRDGTTWIDIGQVAGQPTSIDIDQFGFDEGDFFSFVRVEDRSTYEDNEACIGRAGVDIAGIRALSSTAVPAIDLVKTSDVEDSAELSVGDEITYTFAVTNTGAFDLTAVTVTDLLPNLSDITPASANIDVDQTVEFTATYQVTQADIDAGQIVNTATATGVPPQGYTGEPPTAEDDNTIVIPQNPELEVTKAANTEGPAALGETITYTFTATNTGNVTLSDVTISDELAGLTWVTGPELGDLAPGETAEGTATYVVTEADVLAGSVVNTATGTGVPPVSCVDCEPATSTPPPVTVVTEDPDPAMTLVKTADTEGPVTAGDVITYTFTAENTGNVALTDVTVEDTLAGLEWVTGPNLGDLAPGETATGSATYVVTEADILTGEVVNSATGTGTPPEECVDCTPPTTPPSTVTVPGEDPAPGLALVKTADTEGPVAAGDTITYSFVLENTGNVTLDDVTITDELPGLNWLTGPDLGSIAPGETATGTATYVVTQTDVDNGGVTNSATGTGTPPGDLVPPTTPPSEVYVPGEDPAQSLELVKTADTEGPVAVGETITYSFTATNTGNVTLTDVTITDELPGLTWVEGPNLGTLAPGESATGSATYVATQADINAGGVTNTATATGTPPGDLVPPTTPPSTVTVPGEDSAPAMTLVKSAEPTSGAVLGGTITYTFTVTNTGNVTLTDVVIADALPGLAWVTGPELGTLEPGQAATGTATYVVTQADVNAGGVLNSATGTGTPPSGGEEITTPPSEVFVPIEATSGLAMVKSVSPDTTINAGETLTYTFVVTNIGSTTIDNVTVADTLPGLSAIEGPHGSSLAPGESATFTATYVVTDLDAAAGIVLNTATATGTGPNGDELSAVDSVQIRACMVPGAPAPTEEATDDEDAADDAEAPVLSDPNAVLMATPVVPTEEPTVAPVVEETADVAPMVLQPLEDCEPIPTDPEPEPEPTPVPQQPTNPGNPGGGTTPGGSTGGGGGTSGGGSAPVVKSLPSTGQGATTSGTDTVTIVLVATGLTLMLAAGSLAIRRQRLS